jgi:hypothetical protein
VFRSPSRPVYQRRSCNPGRSTPRSTKAINNNEVKNKIINYPIKWKRTYAQLDIAALRFAVIKNAGDAAWHQRCIKERRSEEALLRSRQRPAFSVLAADHPPALPCGNGRREQPPSGQGFLIGPICLGSSAILVDVETIEFLTHEFHDLAFRRRRCGPCSSFAADVRGAPAVSVQLLMSVPQHSCSHGTTRPSQNTTGQ